MWLISSDKLIQWKKFVKRKPNLTGDYSIHPITYYRYNHLGEMEK